MKGHGRRHRLQLRGRSSPGSDHTSAESRAVCWAPVFLQPLRLYAQGQSTVPKKQLLPPCSWGSPSFYTLTLLRAWCEKWPTRHLPARLSYYSGAGAGLHMEFDKPRPCYLKIINQAGKLLDKMFSPSAFQRLTFILT